MQLPKQLKEERFLIPIKIVSVYLVWKAFHYWATQPGTDINLHWQKAMEALGHLYALATGWLLSLIGIKNMISGIIIYMLDSNRQILVQDHCLAIPGMVVFTGSILFFKGALNRKIKFILLGIAGIVFINILRLVFVCLAWIYLTPYFFHLHHSLIYVVLTYGFIFLMIKFWMDKNS